MRISIVGAGYVGLISSICFAELGHSVKLVELDNEKIQLINLGITPFYEKGSDDLLSKHIGHNLIATSTYEGISDSDVIFICVGTPAAPDGSADLSMVESAARSIGNVLRKSKRYHVVVVKSTVPPGTTQNLVIPCVLETNRKGLHDIGFAMNPEFLREGRAIRDFMDPDRIIIGSADNRAGDLIESVYTEVNAPIIKTEISSAEMIKYASNAFLATKISFSNEIGNLCKCLGIDAYDVMKGVGLDHRISPYFLNAGAGFGGSCIPKDVSALIHLAQDIGEDPVLLKSVMKINEQQPLRMIKLLEKRVGQLQGKKVAVIGLAFKNDTDDIRESRAILVIKELLRKGAEVSAYDPIANETMRQINPEVQYCLSPAEALFNADGCLVMTEWPQFKALDKEFNLMKTRVIIEGRRILRCKDAEGLCW
jgi:UDPglucose 6-dehydrogenase